MNALAQEKFGKIVEEILKDTTKADRIEIHRAIQEGRSLAYTRLAQPQQDIQDLYREIFFNEVGNGARDVAKTPFAKNYAYNQIKKGQNNLGSVGFKREWQNPKKLSVASGKGLGDYTSTGNKIKELALKSEEDAGRAILARHAKSLREQSRAALSKDLITKFGIKSRISPEAAVGRKLRKISLKEEPWLKNELKTGESMYIDQSVHDVISNYTKLSSYTATAESNDLIKTFEKVTSIFKQINTIIWPSFHVRNLTSDIFMNALDGVHTADYEKIFAAMTHQNTAKLRLGNDLFDFKTIKDSYYTTTATGFVNTDISSPLNTLGKSGLNSTRMMDFLSSPKYAMGKLRNASEIREDTGRLVHYYHALDEEYGLQVAKGVGKEKAYKEAEIAANFRVNKYNVDYNALTPFEKNIRRYGIPFYTYTRKITPVLLQNLAMNPRYFSYINKLQDALAPSESFKANKMPSYLVDNNFMQLSDSSNPEPMGFTDALFPTRTIQESFSNPASRFNPIVQAFFEANSGKDTFTKKPVPKGIAGIPSIIENKFKGTGAINNLNAEDKTTTEKWANFLGIPITQVTKLKQSHRQDALTAMLSDKVKAYNSKLENRGVKVSVRGGKVYIVQPKSPSAKEIQDGIKPRYPLRDQEKVIAVYNTLAEIPIKL